MAHCFLIIPSLLILMVAHSPKIVRFIAILFIYLEAPQAIVVYFVAAATHDNHYIMCFQPQLY